MKQFKKLAAPLLAAALLMGTAACGGGGATSSAGTSSPDSSSPSADAVTFTVTADVTGDRAPYVERFAQLVEEKTEGRYTASIIAAGSLGTGSDMAQMLQMGTLDVLLSDDMTMDGVYWTVRWALLGSPDWWRIMRKLTPTIIMAGLRTR